MNTSKRVALYARVSTKGMGQDPEGQLIGLREYAARRGWDVAGEYVDNGFSGAKTSTRPALQQLWKDARQRKFDVVAVWKLDRFGRSLRDLVNSLDEFRSLGIEFVSMTEAIDFGSNLGAVMFALIGAMAEFERNLIRERVSICFREGHAFALYTPPSPVAQAKRRHGSGTGRTPRRSPRSNMLRGSWNNLLNSRSKELNLLGNRALEFAMNTNVTHRGTLCFWCAVFLAAVCTIANRDTWAQAVPSGQAERKTDDLVILFKSLQNTVVTIRSEIGSGTGFIIDPGGLVITNQHVIGPSEYIAAQFDPKTKIAARLVAADPAKDIAVLRINLTALPHAATAEIARNTVTEPSVVEGERVFTIGSPLSQSKIITTGIASKIESHAIISDVNINHGNSGGPLFNSVGQVVGITTFLDPGRPNGPGLSGIVRIEEAMPLIEEAKRKLGESSPPSSTLLPVKPQKSFPLESIKASLNGSSQDVDPYSFRAGDYDVAIITPLVAYQAKFANELAAVRGKQKRTKKDEQAVQDTFRPLDDLKNWDEYIDEYSSSPVIHILATPKLQETFMSALARGMAASKGYYGGPANLRYKTDFYRMRLFCGETEIQPIHPGKIARLINEHDVFVNVADATYQGLYTYPSDAVSPECGPVVLDIYSEKDPNKYTRKVLSDKTVGRVWADFAAYREPSPSKAALQSSQARPAGAVQQAEDKPTTLLTVRRVFVDSFGDDNAAKGLRGWIVSSLSETGSFVVTENKDRADAVLKRDVLENAGADGKVTVVRYAFRLVSKDGDIFWNTTQEAGPDASDLAKQVMAKLLAAVDKTKTSQTVADFSGVYSGEVQNTARGAAAKFEILLRQVNGAIYGCSVVERPLAGSGGFRGTVKDSEIAFETEALKNRIQFIGKLQGDEIKGTFTVRGTADVGQFTVKRTTAQAPPIGYDLGQCRKD